MNERMRRLLIITAVAVIVVITAIVALLARGELAEYVRFRLVNETARALGRDVNVLRLGGDPVRGVVLEGVRIANAPAMPRGSFFETPRAVVRFDVGRLARDLFAGRGVTASITAVELDRPFLVLSRDTKNRWNYADLFEREEGATVQVPTFRGIVAVREGTLVFSDALAVGTPFGAHFERITGRIEFADAPRVRVLAEAVNTDGETPATLSISGRATIGEGTFDLDLSTRGASSAFWGPYLVRLPWLVWRGGTFDGALHLLASRWGNDIALDYRGQLQLRSGQALLLPQQTLLSEVTGPLGVDNTGISTGGLSMSVSSASARGRASPVWMRGTIRHVGGVNLDLAVRSPSLDLATLQRLIFPGAAVRLQGLAGGDARIIGSYRSPRIDGRIVDASGLLNRQGFTDARGDFSFYGGLLVFDRFSMATGGGELDGHFRLGTGDRTFFALAEAHDIDTQILPGFGLTLVSSLRGSASGIMAAAGAPGDVTAQGHVLIERGAVLSVGFDWMDVLFGYDQGRLEVDRLLAQSGPSKVHAYGAVGRSGGLAMTVSADDVSLRTVGRRFGLGSRLNGRADLIGELRGTTRAPILEADIAARDGSLGPFLFDSAFGRVRVTPASFATPGLHLRDGAGVYDVAGSIRWNGTGRFDLRVQAENVPAQRLLEVAEVPLDLRGTIRGALQLSGPLNRPLASGSVELRDGQVEGQRVDRAQADFRWTGTHLLLDRAAAVINSSSVEARGSVSRRGALNIAFSASAFRLRDVGALRTDILDVDGIVDLAGTLTGTLRAPTVTAEISSTSLALDGQRFDRAGGRVQYRAQRLTLNPLELQRGTGTFLITGNVELRRDPSVDLRVNARGADVSSLLGLARVRPPFALRGTIDGQLTLAGRLSNPGATINVELRDGKIGEHPIRDAAVQATLADRAVTLHRLTVHPEQGELIGAGRIDLRRESDVEFAGRGLSLDLLRPLLRIGRPLAGTLEFTLQLSGRLADPVVGLSATVTEGAIGSAGFDQLIVQAFYRDGQFQISPAVLQEGPHKARLEGSVPFNPAQFRFDHTRPMDLRLSLVDADLSVLGLFTDAVEQASGPLAGEVRLSGTVSQPKMQGTLTTTDGSIKLHRIEPAFSAVRGTVTFREDEMRVDQFTARMGEGTLTASGTVGIRNFRPDRLQLQLAADGARLAYDPHFAGRIDGMLRIEGTAARPVVAGAVVLSHGDLQVGAPRRTIAGGPGLNPLLDIDLQSGDELWVNIGDLRLQVHGAVHAAGTWQDPRLSGEVTASRGNFTAFNTAFALTEGRATFTEFRGLTPFIDATAETRVRMPVRGAGQPLTPGAEVDMETVTVFVHIQGTPDNLTLEMSSDPAHTREEILAGLAGQARLIQAVRGDVPFEAVLRAELSQALFGSIGREVARALGFEEFVIEYDFEQHLQLRIGKLLISNLYVTLTSEFGIDPRYIWSLEYRFSPSTQLRLSVDNKSVFDLLYIVTYRF